MVQMKAFKFVYSLLGIYILYIITNMEYLKFAFEYKSMVDESGPVEIDRSIIYMRNIQMADRQNWMGIGCNSMATLVQYR